MQGEEAVLSRESVFVEASTSKEVPHGTLPVGEENHNASLVQVGAKSL